MGPHRAQRALSYQPTPGWWAAEHYNYFRDYDPGIGRYVESDPIGLRGGRNTYGYVLQQPLGMFDAIGMANSGPWPRPKPGAGDSTTYIGGEFNYGVGGGLTTVRCKLECGKEQVFRYVKICIGGAAGGGATAGMVGNMSGPACRSDTYKGWFFEGGYTAWGLSGGVDIGFNETDWKVPGAGVGLPFGMSGVNEAGAGPGLGAGVKATWCYYIPLQ